MQKSGFLTSQLISKASQIYEEVMTTFNIYNVLRDSWRKSEANEDHQFGLVDQATDERALVLAK